MMLSVNERLELGLSLAREAAADVASRQVRGALRLLELFRPPEYETYQPGALFRQALPQGSAC